jgi:hypothetical protein
MVEGFSMLNQRYTMGSLATIEARPPPSAPRTRRCRARS